MQTTRETEHGRAADDGRGLVNEYLSALHKVRLTRSSQYNSILPHQETSTDETLRPYRFSPGKATVPGKADRTGWDRAAGPDVSLVGSSAQGGREVRVKELCGTRSPNHSLQSCRQVLWGQADGRRSRLSEIQVRARRPVCAHGVGPVLGRNPPSSFPQPSSAPRSDMSPRRSGTIPHGIARICGEPPDRTSGPGLRELVRVGFDRRRNRPRGRRLSS